MAPRHLLLIAAMVFVFPLATVADQAEAPKLEVQQQDTMATLLRRHVGKRVSLRLQAGEELTGTVRMVGEHVVHLSDLAGRDFYDAVVDLEDVSAVVVRVRGGA